MRKAGLWELDYGNTDVAYRADDADYLPPASGGIGWREGSF